ncbi:MAG TPA: type II toxin-antitoxin system VapC family toxin [Rhizomicrobium sp.]
MIAVADALPKRFTVIVPLRILAARAGEIAVELDHPVYDAFYIALAEQEHCVLVTADDRLFRKTRRTPFAKLVKTLT